MIEGGLDTLDKVEAGDVDAEDALEFGVKIGEENTGTAAGTMNGIFCLKFALNPLIYSLARKNDQKKSQILEVMYVNGTTKICHSSANYPGNVYYLSGSSFLNSNTIVACGGYLGKGLRTSDCYSMSNDLKWTHFANLTGRRSGIAAVVVKNGLWVTGNGKRNLALKQFGYVS